MEVREFLQTLLTPTSLYKVIISLSTDLFNVKIPKRKNFQKTHILKKNIQKINIEIVRDAE